MGTRAYTHMGTRSPEMAIPVREERGSLLWVGVMHISLHTVVTKPSVWSYSLGILAAVCDFVHILRFAPSCNYSFVTVMR